MANGTNISAPYNSYEYYMDYLDLIPVDEKKLKAPKYSIVIVFWVSLAAFVLLLFLILLYMSWSGSPQMRSGPQHHRACPWSRSLSLPLCIRRHLPCHRLPQGTSQTPPSSVKDPESGAGSDQRLWQESPSASLPGSFKTNPLSSGSWHSKRVSKASADVKDKPSEPSPEIKNSSLQNRHQ
ncbi:melanocortin-2 receptor accessory protein [Otolemur garnettii]|nr:melanocortin-2 receptor accessory protein [Otolemur garnettii]